MKQTSKTSLDIELLKAPSLRSLVAPKGAGGYIYIYTHLFLSHWIDNVQVGMQFKAKARDKEKTVQTAELAPIIMAPTQRVVLARTRSSNRHNRTHELYTGSHSLMPTTATMVQLAV